MKILKTVRVLTGVIIAFVFIICLSSCGTTKNARSASQRQGLMLMDKSEYTVNKGRFTSTKNYKAIKRKPRKSYNGAYRR